MKNALFSFELVDEFTPEYVIKEKLEQIQTATNGYVIGNITNYEGNIQSYTKPTGLGVALRAFQEGSCDVDIQDDLGEQSDEKHRYQVYLSVKNMEKYMYRLMFVDYGAISYPVTIVLSEDIAMEYTDKTQDTFIIDSMKELQSLMDRVINSKTLIRLIQNLINESIRRERRMD